MKLQKTQYWYEQNLGMLKRFKIIVVSNEKAQNCEFFMVF